MKEDFFEILATKYDPEKVPEACAKKGKTKYFKSQFVAFIGEKSTGVSKIHPPRDTNPILIIIPKIIPRKIIAVFLNMVSKI